MTANANGRNPFLKNLGEKAAAAAALTRLREKLQDEYVLASFALRDLERQVATFPLTESGVVVPAGYAQRVARARAQVEQATSAYHQALERERPVIAELHDLQRSASRWDEQEAYLASQAAARAEEDARLTPRQRAIRAAKQLLDEGVR
jgi:hypothetical protein